MSKNCLWGMFLVVLGVAVAAGPQCEEIFVDLDDVRKEGPEYEEVSRILVRLPEWMKDDCRCARFFGGRERVADWALRLLHYKLVAVAKTTSVADPTGTIINGFTSSCGARVRAGYAAIFVASNGSFFNRHTRTAVLVDGHWKYYEGGSIPAKLILILHEIAHSMELGGFFHDDRGNPWRSSMNNGIVVTECKKTIENAIRHTKAAERELRHARKSFRPQNQ